MAEKDGSVSHKRGRPALLVSSTSWTADEDFSILLQALNGYEEAARAAEGSLPRVLVVITGKGGLKAEFERNVARLEKAWHYVRCRTAWLESGDYPKLLGGWASFVVRLDPFRASPSGVIIVLAG